jgi:hypothetical protein
MQFALFNISMGLNWQLKLLTGHFPCLAIHLPPFTFLMLKIKKMLKRFAFTRWSCPKPYELSHFYLLSDSGPWLGLIRARL